MYICSLSPTLKLLTSNPAHSPPATAEIKKLPAIPTPFPPYTFLAEYLIKHLENLTFYYCKYNVSFTSGKGGLFIIYLFIIYLFIFIYFFLYLFFYYLFLFIYLNIYLFIFIYLFIYLNIYYLFIYIYLLFIKYVFIYNLFI
jgi:hypothetical protein